VSSPRPHRIDALIAIVDWMGAYEDDQGPIGPRVDAGKLTLDSDLSHLVSPDMISGYQLACRLLAEEEMRLARRLAKRRIAAQLGTSPARIRDAQLSGFLAKHADVLDAALGVVRAGGGR